ncbi:MAG: hypothetical protein QHC79_14900 [Pseudosphingobacterium sp.]|nr:hypothetical protein [Pseudosphingobacterium sp.]
MIALFGQVYNSIPINKALGLGGHQANQTLYWSTGSVSFDYQLQTLIDVGAKWSRVDLGTDVNGNIQSSAPNYSYYRLFGTSPADIGTESLPETDGRKHNYGWYYKCNAAGINILPMVSVIASDPNNPGADGAWWTARYATPQDAFNQGYQQGSGFIAAYGQNFSHVELGNELELFTKLLNGNGSGTHRSHYYVDRLDRAVQYIRGMEEGIKAVSPNTITMFNIAGWLASYLMDSVLEAAPSINKIAWHWYSDHQGRIKQTADASLRLPGDGKQPASWTFNNIFEYISNRYPGKKVWLTEFGYIWSEYKTYTQNEQDMFTNFQSIIADFNNSSNGEVAIYHELLEMHTTGDFNKEMYYGLVGYPDFDNTGRQFPYKKLLCRWLEENKLYL